MCGPDAPRPSARPRLLAARLPGLRRASRGRNARFLGSARAEAPAPVPFLDQAASSGKFWKLSNVSDNGDPLTLWKDRLLSRPTLSCEVNIVVAKLKLFSFRRFHFTWETPGAASNPACTGREKPFNALLGFLTIINSIELLTESFIRGVTVSLLGSKRLL